MTRNTEEPGCLIGLKAQWVVRAGLLPGEALANYTQAFEYTSIDYQADGNKRGHRFELQQQAVEGYRLGLELGSLNWVQVEYLWM